MGVLLGSAAMVQVDAHEAIDEALLAVNAVIVEFAEGLSETTHFPIAQIVKGFSDSNTIGTIGTHMLQQEQRAKDESKDEHFL